MNFVTIGKEGRAGGNFTEAHQGGSTEVRPEEERGWGGEGYLAALWGISERGAQRSYKEICWACLENTGEGGWSTEDKDSDHGHVYLNIDESYSS